MKKCVGLYKADNFMVGEYLIISFALAFCNVSPVTQVSVNIRSYSMASSLALI